MLCKCSLCFNNEWKAQVPHSGLKSGCRRDIFTSPICSVKAVEMHLSNEKIVSLLRLTLHFLLQWKLRTSNVSYWQVLCINFTSSSSKKYYAILLYPLDCETWDSKTCFRTTRVSLFSKLISFQRFRLGHSDNVVKSYFFPRQCNPSYLH